MVTSESIENPRDPKPDDHEKVEAAPGQSVEPEWDIGVNDGGRQGGLLHSNASKPPALGCPSRRRMRRQGNAAKSIRFGCVELMRNPKTFLARGGRLHRRRSLPRRGLNGILTAEERP